MVEKERRFSNTRVLVFIFTLCFVCALILSILAYALKTPQTQARDLYKSKQLLRAAAILSYDNVFLLDGTPALYDEEKELLLPSPKSFRKAKDKEILAIFQTRVLPRLTDDKGKLYTFEEAGINEEDYLQDNEKYGYAKLPFKLLYVILPNGKKEENFLPYGYVIPINGYGLWDAIYGYLGLKANADTVLGMTWYDQKETPGLGGNIALPKWQQQFEGKVIFQKSPSGKTDFARASLGIKVVKTSVQETYGDTPLAASAVDGIAGASITVIGVNEALRNSLEPYRPFLIKAHERGAKK